MMRRVMVAVVVMAGLMASVAGFAPMAQAQDPVVGTADFRNAPLLGPGSYSDRLVTGDTAWYSVAYINDDDYRFAVSLAGVTPGSTPELDLNLSFVAPTLTTIDGPAAVVEGPGFEYSVGHTNIWFLKVSLETTGQVGLEYPIEITVEGVQNVGAQPCSELPGCSLDDELRTLNGDLAQARADLAEVNSQDTLEAVERELANLDGFVQSARLKGPEAQSRLLQAQNTMATLCAPELTCEEFPNPGTKTPLIGWVVGIAVLGFGLFRASKKLKRDTSAEEPEVEDPSVSEPIPQVHAL